MTIFEMIIHANQSKSLLLGTQIHSQIFKKNLIGRPIGTKRFRILILNLEIAFLTILNPSCLHFSLFSLSLSLALVKLNRLHIIRPRIFSRDVDNLGSLFGHEITKVG